VHDGAQQLRVEVDQAVPPQVDELLDPLYGRQPVEALSGMTTNGMLES
jgi:hypothetical protein